MHIVSLRTILDRGLGHYMKALYDKTDSKDHIMYTVEADINERISAFRRIQG
jgi:hypothetical protein